MAQDDLRDALLPIFQQECAEHLEAMIAGLLALEQLTNAAIPESDELGLVFRCAHSMKGAARAVGVTCLADAMHTVEDLLGAWRSRNATPTPDSITQILAVLDVVTLIANESFEESEVERLSPDLAAAVGQLAGNRESTDQTTAGDPRSAQPNLGPGPADSSVVPQPRPSAMGSAPFESSSPLQRAAVRVNSEKLDGLVSHCGELAIARHRLLDRASDLRELRSQFTEVVELTLAELDTRDPSAADSTSRGSALVPDALARFQSGLGAVTRRLLDDQYAIEHAAEVVEEQALNMRMLPFQTLVGGIERLVRDTSRALGKQASLEIRGSELEIDRVILDGLKDPLAHLIRNSIDHGIEQPKVRRESGKPAAGSILIQVELSGGSIRITVKDDGAGIDEEKVRSRAESVGLIDSSSAIPIGSLITMPGISTSDTVSEFSGRGVGMDVVRSQVGALRGAMNIESIRNHGCTVKLTVPMSLSTIQAILVRCADSTVAVPQSHLDKLLRVPKADVHTIGHGRSFTLGREAVRLYTLAERLGYGARPNDYSDDALKVLLLVDGSDRVGFVVDEFLDQREVLLRDLGVHLRYLKGLLGVSVMSDGTLSLVINGPELVRSTNLAEPATGLAASGDTPTRNVLVVDDSITTRTLVQAVLEAAGYRVRTAVDGELALRKLGEGGIDAVVSDIEMPNVDGLELTRRIRASAAHRHLPVILVSGVNPAQANNLAAEAGADVFVPKGEFTSQALVDAVTGLLNDEAKKSSPP